MGKHKTGANNHAEHCNCTTASSTNACLAPGRITPPLPTGWNNWEELMNLALEQAAKAASTGEVPVGAIIVDAAGNIIAAAHNNVINGNDPCAHAEVCAIRQAAQKLGNYRLNNCVMLVSLEPCLMCTAAIVQARIAGLVYAAAEPKSGTVSTCCNALNFPFHNHKVWYMGGVLEQESSALLQNFFAQRRD